MSNWNKIVKIEFEYAGLNGRYYMILIYENGEEEKKEITSQLYKYIRSIIEIKEEI